MRRDELCLYREGVTLGSEAPEGTTIVNVGLSSGDTMIDRSLKPGVRVTVRLEDGGKLKKTIHGKAVPPTEPKEKYGLYWGYHTRLARSLGDVFSKSTWEGGYDLLIGCSSSGTRVLEQDLHDDIKSGVDDSGKQKEAFSLGSFQHALIVFGGTDGSIESCVDADESLPINASNASSLFDHWVNLCPGSGTRSLRTEEEVLISLARLYPYLNKK